MLDLQIKVFNLNQSMCGRSTEVKEVKQSSRELVGKKSLVMLIN